MESESRVQENMDFSKLKVPELKRELKSRGLNTSGHKTDLVVRLQEAFKSKLDDTASGESAEDLIDDDLLNDDDSDHEQLDESESVLTDLDSTLDVSISKSEKRKLEQNELPEHTKPAKKIVLNRVSLTASETHETEDESALCNKRDVKVDVKTEDRKVIKLSELSAKERLDMRAKKFGVLPSVDARRAARAERFGGSLPVATARTISLDKASPVVNALKKRADRFGGSVSTVMSRLENQEKLERRKERFGLVPATNGSSSQSDKAKQRLERFKTTVK